MTPSQIETAARRKYNAVGDSLWSTEEIFGLIDAAQLDSCSEGMLIEKIFTSSTVADQEEYDEPDNVVQIKHNVSLIDFVVELEAAPTLDEIAELFRGAAAGELRGILATTEEELVSSDFLGDPHSAIVDLPLLSSVGSGLYRVVAWYDNEWGHASRLADILELVGGTPA